MKSITVIACSILLLCAFSACKKKRPSLVKVENYKSTLENTNLDSASKNEIQAIDYSFKQNNLRQLSNDELKTISSESSFVDALKSEKILLNDWQPIPRFKGYSKVTVDSVLSVIRRCSAFDRGSPDLERVPSYRSLRSLSAEYYSVEVPIAFHIIASSDGKGVLNDMNGKINDQVKLLNDVYAPFHITFKLQSVDQTVNDVWYNSASYYNNKTALNAMTKQLSKNPGKTMNVYSVGSLAVLGESTFPWYPENGTSGDYVLINYNTLPGGPSTFFKGMYNMGKTLVHEAGHYLGLYHTFEGGNVTCNSPANDGCNIGDQVDDTPSQKICYFEGCGICPPGVECDSCPAPGKDPVKNYMGYDPDNCMTEMTPGQGERLIRSIIKYRYYFITNPV